jgi:hypothetical protein
MADVRLMPIDGDVDETDRRLAVGITIPHGSRTNPIVLSVQHR